MRIAVAGGTGWTGKLVVDALHRGGHEPVIVARSAGVDVLSGAGLVERLAGVDTVIDVTNIRTQSRKKSQAFFETATTHLLAAEETAGVTHHLVLSIVGCDRVDLGYYLGKRRQEELALTGPIPTTVLRATQFHEFAAQMLAARGPVVLAPKMRCQPIALTEVAQRLADLSVGEPAGRTPDLAGPEPNLMMDEMISRLAQQRGDRRPKLRVAMPGAVGRQIKEGGLLPVDDGPRGAITFDEWLAGAGQ
ncbi:MAG: hypothetical protein U0R64_11415 [Candidatus Nanopelagicales bacterium]